MIAGCVPQKAFLRQTYLAIHVQSTIPSQSSVAAMKALASLRCLTFLGRRLLLAIIHMRENNLTASFHGDDTKRRASTRSVHLKKAEQQEQQQNTPR